MDRIFNMDNKFFTFMGRLADLAILNILCIICCIPIVTAGASISSLYYMTMKMVRNEESYIVKGFFHSFKQNLKQSIAINLIMLLAGVMLVADIYIVRHMEGTSSKILTYIFMVMAILYVMVYTYVYPLLAKFYNTVKNTFVNAFLMSLRHLPYTLLMIVFSALPFAILFIPSANIQSLLFVLALLLGFATVAYCKSYFLVKIFDKYIPQEETEETPSENTEELPDSSTPSV